MRANHFARELLFRVRARIRLYCAGCSLFGPRLLLRGLIDWNSSGLQLPHDLILRPVRHHPAIVNDDQPVRQFKERWTMGDQHQRPSVQK